MSCVRCTLRGYMGESFAQHAQERTNYINQLTLRRHTVACDVGLPVSSSSPTAETDGYGSWIIQHAQILERDSRFHRWMVGDVEMEAINAIGQLDG